MKKGQIKKALKPSERESITEFSTAFGTGTSYEKRIKRRRIATLVFTVVGILLLIALGFFITEVLIDITELPLP